jgi:hypothetical protein
MKLAAVVLTALVSLTGLASADDYPTGPTPPAQIQQRPRRAELRRERRQLRRERRIQKIIRKYDLNHDGVVDQGELPPRLARRLARLDRNGDGWIDQADLAPRQPRR